MRQSTRILVLFAIVAVLAAAKPFVVDGRGAFAQSGDRVTSPNWTYADPADHYENSWAASNGYISVPHASSLASAPTWKDRRRAPAADTASPRAMLAIIGLPVDTDHEMLAAAKPERLCLAAQSEQAVSLCKDGIGREGDSDFSFNFSLCAFHGDCWHSTAAAILATGSQVDPRHFSLEAISKLPFWNLTDDVTSRRLSFYNDAQNIAHARFNICRDADESWFNTDVSESVPECDSEAFSRQYDRAYTLFPNLPQIMRSAADIPIKYFTSRDDSSADNTPLTKIIASNAPSNARTSAQSARTSILADQAEVAALQKLADGNGQTSAAKKRAEARKKLLEERISNKQDAVQFHEAVNYAKLPQLAFPMVETYSAEQANCCSAAGLSALVNDNLLVPRGARQGGPLIAFNVFSAVNDPAQCQRAGSPAPCVLTKLTSQEKALAYLLERVKTEKELGGTAKSRIGAILIIAGGEKARGPCNNNRTAELIAELRKQGVYTFVPVGNDGDPRAVRFPACASAAISVGSLDRNGDPMPISNGSQTGMVRLYADGDTVVIPMRAPPPDQLRGCLQVEAFKKTIQTYQKALRRLHYPLKTDSGLADAETQDALQAFQRAKQLPPNGRFTPETLEELDKQVDLLNKQPVENNDDTAAADDDAVERKSVAENVRLARLLGFEDYDGSLCDKSVANPYHAYFVGGTLVSAAVMAGTFLDLLDAHPLAGSDAVATVILAASKEKPARLLTPADFSKAEQQLK